MSTELQNHQQGETPVRVLDIGGVKMAVDMRTAKTVSEYRVGDKVKVLKKRYDDYKVYAGVIVGFDEFKDLPTMVICYLEQDYSEAKLKFQYFNKETKDVEITPCLEHEILFEYADMVKKLENNVLAKEKELSQEKHKLDYFVKNFKKHFGEDT